MAAVSLGFRLPHARQSQAPCQVRNISEASVHALSAEWTMQMSTVATKEDSVLVLEAGSAAMVHFVCCKPIIY